MSGRVAVQVAEQGLGDAHAIRRQNELGRISAILAGEFAGVAPELIEQRLRVEFERRAGSPVQDFVPIFVQRSVRAILRSKLSDQSTSPEPGRAGGPAESAVGTLERAG